MTEVDPVLTVAVPCYNSEDYMHRCLDSLLIPAARDVQVVIVNDGSSDRTEEIAEQYGRDFPHRVVVVNKENGGHGSAINAGLKNARGTYFKVVDSDDWLDPDAYKETLDFLRAHQESSDAIDLVITNFVYEKDGKRFKRKMSYSRRLPVRKRFAWKEMRRFRVWEYLLMHSMIYRTRLLVEVDLEVPEHSFYVDNYFAFIPLESVESLAYLDVDLYRYHIGREDQSVNEKIMLSRIDQQINVNLEMVKHLDKRLRQGTLPPELARYMAKYAAIVTGVSTVLLARGGAPEHLAKKRWLSDHIETAYPTAYKRMMRHPFAKVVSRQDPLSLAVMRAGYSGARYLVGFN